MLGKWVLYKRQHDSSLTSQRLGTQLVAGLSGLAYEWCRWLPQEAQNEMLSTDDADQQILRGLSKEFYGFDTRIPRSTLLQQNLLLQYFFKHPTSY